MKLLIVESPTKAKTISRFLGKDFKVESSYGHMRDLPKSKMGVDIEHNFEPQYVIPMTKRKKCNELKKQAGKAKEIYFATDEDREGEAIAWHLAQIFEQKPEQAKRITFHEITKQALSEAIKNPRGININLVNAQQARRILDRLVGYELSPFLWRKVAKGLSAGRVQSVAVRLIVERERERQAFKPQEYWSIEALLAEKTGQEITAKLHKIDNKILDKFDLKQKQQVEPMLKDLKNADYIIEDISKKTVKRNPAPPLTTSTLQQEANKKLGFSAKQTMKIAQELYEGVDLDKQGSVGLITYMRTDSVSLSEKFIKEARDFIEKQFGEKYLPKNAPRYKTKTKSAQEAHEAIRPTDAALRPEQIKKLLNTNQHKLYDLVWKRALASQANPAVIDQTSIEIKADKYGLKAVGSVINFDGFLRIHGEIFGENLLPELVQGDKLELKKLIDKQHFTEPPARYSDATLVKSLEEYGIGRPSTYAPTIATIIERNYVQRDENKRLGPSELAFIVTDLLKEHFPKIVDYEFTARLEQDLDDIAHHAKEWVPVIREFYTPFHENLEKKDKKLDKKEITEEETGETCEKCGKPMIRKIGRYGPFIACSGFPDCRNIKSLKKEDNEDELLKEKCEKCGGDMVIKRGRYGKFLACSKYPDCKFIKNIQKSTGVKCPKCEKGEVVMRRSKKGRVFYGCGKYPDCDFVLWQRPTGEKCPNCGALVVYKAKDKAACSNPECGFEKEQKNEKT
ncbi:type I DNA topoisomerase [Patescibacteria group bacterium]|nr:type I DNA topoisomerase [Patescibacteria group bacterium]MBU1921881.1 type I DNA topoisomerase [Patescibacteria group bacterium]